MQCPECGGGAFLATQFGTVFVTVRVDANGKWLDESDLDNPHITWNDIDEIACAECGAGGSWNKEELDEVQFNKEKSKTKEPVLRGGSLPKEDA